jgi:hypothetical protein
MKRNDKIRFMPAIKAAVVCLVLGFLSVNTANAQSRGGEGELQLKKGLGFVGFDCKPGFQKDPNKKGYCTACGRANQPGCEAARKGPQCLDHLQLIDGICQGRGGEGERQLEKGLGFVGFDCNPGFQKDPKRKGYCTACGRVNQPGCEAARKGPQCHAYLQLIDGICRARGGEGQLQYKKGLGFLGYDCKPGYQKDPNKKGYCTACGDLNQPSCEITRTWSGCAEGLKPKTFGTFGKCVPDDAVERELKKQATAIIIEHLGQIVDIVIKASNERAQTARVRAAVDSYKRAPKKGAEGSAAGITSYNFTPLTVRNTAGMTRSRAGIFQSWTLGAGGDANVGVGVSLETGLAFPLSNDAEKAYTSVSTDFQIGFGGSAGVTVGLSTDAYNNQGGKSLGYKVSVASVIDFVKDLKDLKQLAENFSKLGAAEPDLSIGVWFKRTLGGGVGAFQGITATIGGAAGPNVGATYSKGQTFQF